MLAIYSKELSKKYAQAFLNTFRTMITEDIVLKTAMTSKELSKIRALLIRLNNTLHSQENKKIVNSILIEKYELPEFFRNLFDLLIKDRKLTLISDVLKAIVGLYHQEKNIKFFDITSSHELSSDQLHDLQKFLECQTGAKIHYKHTVDSSLIAGIKLQSDLCIWEYSIRKQLKALRGIIH